MTPPEQAYGSALLGSADQPVRVLRVRIQLLLTFTLVITHLIGAGIVVVLTSWVVPHPATADGMRLALAIAIPVYIGLAIVIGIVVGTALALRALAWVREERDPTTAERHRAIQTPLRLTVLQGGLWAAATVLFSVLALILQPGRAVSTALTVGIAGLVVSAVAYLLTEFIMRPVAARALEDDQTRRTLRGLGVGGRMVTFWLLGTGAPIIGLVAAAILALAGSDVSATRLAVQTLVLGCIVLVFGLLVTLLNSRAVVSPVEQVRTALTRVENGDFSGRLTVYDATQLGLLQAGFNQMTAGLAERERLRDLFGRHVGHQVARAAAAVGGVELGGEQRVVSVLFVDVVGSTAFASERAPSEVVEVLNSFFAVVVDEVDRHEGLVNKFLGDAVLAVFGAPVDLPDHATQALQAARGMARRLAVECPEVGAGIGVFTGEVVAGNVGTAARLEYTVIGDAVNAAARLVEQAKQVPGGIAVAGETVDAATEDERAHWRRDQTHAEPVVLRGRSRSTAIFVASV